MGYMRHHGMMMTSFSEKYIKAAHDKALEIFGGYKHISGRDFKGLVSGVSHEQVNGYRSFAVFPDGSKEGWSESDSGDKCRKEFKEWLAANNSKIFVTWAEFQFGDEDGNNKMLDDSDKYPEEEEK